MTKLRELGERLREREAPFAAPLTRRSLDLYASLEEWALISEVAIDLAFDRGSLTEQDRSDILELAEAGAFGKGSDGYARMIKDLVSA